MFPGLYIPNMTSPQPLEASGPPPLPYPYIKFYQNLYSPTQKAFSPFDHKEHTSFTIIVLHKLKTYLKNESSPYTLLTTDHFIPIDSSFYECVGGGGFFLLKSFKNYIINRYPLHIKTVYILTITFYFCKLQKMHSCN
jgi:hypothetical protein